MLSGITISKCDIVILSSSIYRSSLEGVAVHNHNKEVATFFQHISSASTQKRITAVSQSKIRCVC